MKAIINILALLSLFASNSIFALDDISGTWQGELPLQGGATLTVQFIIKKEDNGSWSAVVNSPDTGGIKNVRASSTAFDGSSLKIKVPELSGAYTGAFMDGAFEGTWSQAGTSMPLNLKPYEKPVLSRADMERLQGEWNGKLKIPAGKLSIVYRFEIKPSGELSGFLDSPDQGSTGIPISDIELSNGDLKFKVPSIMGDYQAKLSGENMTGTFTQRGLPLALNMQKGKYQPPETKLSLSKEAMDQLMGDWHGDLDTPAGSMTVVYRFETDAEGNNHAFRINPERGNTSIPVIKASLKEGNLILKTPGLGGEFNGKLSGDKISGNISGPLGSLPITLKRGKYVPPVYALGLSQEAMALLQGKWQGKLKTPQREMTLVFRFETKDDGKYYGYIDSPDQGGNGLKIIQASLNGSELSLKTKFPKAEFKGKLDGDELDGQWMQGPGTMPLTMKKD